MNDIELIHLAKSGDQTATEKLINDNAGLIWSIVKKFLNRGYEAEDLYQVGSIGLLKCIRKFDDAYNVKFSTYAVPMIMGEIKRFMRDDGMLKVSRPLKELAVKAKYLSDALTQTTNSPPTMEELSKALNVPTEELVLALSSSFTVESLYSTTSQNDNETYLIDKWATRDDSSKTLEHIALKQLIVNLSSKERQVIILRYFCDKTQAEVGKLLGVSQVQVSRIEKKVLKYLRDEL
ncbi:RNA polymerase sigma factor [Clostridia bacterium]|nr:RNA polymerase sigma factor [Clostridia bacterium]